jgi:hypothetical protein
MSCHHTTLFFIIIHQLLHTAALACSGQTPVVSLVPETLRAAPVHGTWLASILQEPTASIHGKLIITGLGNIQRFIHSYQFIVNARKWNLSLNWSQRASILFSIIFVKRIRSHCENGKEREGFNSYQCFSFVTCNLQHFQISFQGTT